MPLKARRALIATDGTIYCNAGTVLEDDDPVAVRNINAVVGSTEPVTEGFQKEGAAPITPDPVPVIEVTLEEAHEGHAEQVDVFLSESEGENEDEPEEAEEEEDDEGVEM